MTGEHRTPLSTAVQAGCHKLGNALLAGCLTFAVLASGLAECGTVFAQSPSTQVTPNADAATKALTQLFENVAFWTQRGQPTVALHTLERAIALSPADADTLALAARLNFQLDHYDAANAYRLRLQKLWPDDPRLPALSAEQKRTPEELRILGEARRLAAAGRKEEAILAYRQFFNNKVPDSLAIEFYTILGTTSAAGFKIATEELPKVAARWEGDTSFRLANARLLTFEAGTRSAGIKELAELTKLPMVAAAARVAWHDALLWQGPDAVSRDEMDLYLKENATDAALETKRKEIQDNLPDEGLMARLRAYEDVAAGRKDQAEKGFMEALRIHPDDADAMIMLALIRREQMRQKEAVELIAKAMALAPDRRQEFTDMLVVSPDNTASVARNSAANAAIRQRIAADYAQVKTFTDQRRFDDAEKLLRRLAGKTWNGQTYLSLGYIQKEAGKLREAETSFRAALKSDPGNADGMLALAEVLANQNKLDEVDTLYAHARDAYAKQPNKNGLILLDRAQSERLRLQAEADTDPAGAIRTFRKALNLDPGNPWSRLGLARALLKQGDTAEAKRIMARAVAEERPTNDALQAGIIFADQIGDLDQANRLIARIPPGERTASMRDAQTRLGARTEVKQALAGGRAARERLLAIAAQPDPTGVRVDEIGRALMKTRERATMRDAVAAGIAATPRPTAQQRLMYGGILLGGEQAGDAAAVLSSLDRASLDADQQKYLDELLNGIALQQSDKLVRRGRGNQALTYLTPRLSAQPNDTSLNLGLSRAYTADGKSDEAVAMINDMLKSKPDDLNIRIGAIDAAIANGERRRAEDLVSRGIEQFPQDAQLYVRSANLKMANGHKQEALADFRQARDLRQKQLLP